MHTVVLSFVLLLILKVAGQDSGIKGLDGFFFVVFYSVGKLFKALEPLLLTHKAQQLQSYISAVKVALKTDYIGLAQRLL